MRGLGERGDIELFRFFVFSVFCLALIWGCQKHGQSDNSPRFPSFNSADFAGRLIDSKEFLGRHTLVISVDPKKARDLEACRIIRNKEGENLNIILLAWPGTLPNDILEDQGFRIFADPDRRLSRSFMLPQAGLYLLYDPDGRLVGSGNNQSGYEEGPKAMLAWHLHGLRFQKTMLIPEVNGQLGDSPWLRQVESLISAIPRQFYLIGFFSTVCDSCSSGSTMMMMARLRDAMDANSEVRVFLSPSFNEIDIERMRSQLRLNFPIELAEGALSEKWKDLNEIYRPADINELIVLLDSTGRVRMVYEPAANDPQETFFHKILEEIKAGKK